MTKTEDELKNKGSVYMENTSKAIMEYAVKILDGKMGENIQVLRVEDLTVLTEYMVLCSGTSTTQLKFLADEAEHKLQEEGIKLYKTEGYTSGNWIVLDYGSVIIHIFNQEAREFYKLDRLWADGEKINIDNLLIKR
jgi:ribosome-associated protein